MIRSALAVSRLHGLSIKSHRCFPRLSLLPALVTIAVSGAPPSYAADYVWLNSSGTGNWFTGNNWSPSGPPPFGSPGSAFIDNAAGTTSRVQIAPLFFVSTPNCSGLGCGVSAAANTLRIDSGDTVVIGGSAVFSDNGAYYNNGQSRLEMIETSSGAASILNNGVLRLSSEGKNSVLAVQGLVTLSGAGETILGNGYAAADSRSNFNSNQIVYGSSSAFGSNDPPKLVVAAGHTVRGSGRLGYNGSLAIVNHGTIKADGPGELQVNGLGYFPAGMPFPIVNDGLMRAESGGRMWIMSRVDNTGGVIEALAGSTVELTDAVRAGTLRSVGTGVVQTRGTNGFATYLTGVTIEGRLTVPDGVHANFGLDGTTSTIVNNGTIAAGVRPAGATGNAFGSTLTLYGDTAFSGSGRIEYTDAPGNKFASYSGFLGRSPVATIGAGQVLTGVFEIKTSMVNQGRIDANGAVNTLTIGSGGVLTNQGELVVSGAAPVGLQIAGGQLVNEGTFTVAAGSSILGNVVQNSGVTTVQGAMLDGIFQLKGGVLKGVGEFWGTVNNQGGVFAPGTSPGSTTVLNYTQSSGDLVLEIDGDGSGQRDHLTILGNASFYGGRIVIDLSDYTGGGTPTLNDLLTVAGTLRLEHPVLHTSASIAVVGLAAGLDADVTWNGNSLGVTLAAPVPEPQTYALLLAGLGLVGLVARRRARTAG